MKISGIKTKVIIITALAMSLLTILISAIGYVKFDQNVLSGYITYAELIIKVTDTVFRNYKVGDMIVDRDMPPEYERTRHAINGIKEDADIKYLYAVYFEDIHDLHSICYVINAKTEAERNTGAPLEDIYSFMGEPCELDAFADSTLNLFKEAILLNDGLVRFEESETSQYGRLITCYKVINDSNGNAVGIVAADVDVNQIKKDLMNYIKIVLITALFFTTIVIILFLTAIDVFITHPIEMIAKSTDAFVKLMNENVNPDELVYNKIEVSGKDEIYTLSEGVASMADGVRNYMVNLESVTAEKERIGAELNVATQIQADMLPSIFPPFPERTEFDIYATMDPAKEVGGDFYDFFLIDDDHLGVTMADVSGKGVPAALFMVIAKTLIKNKAQLGGTPAEVLSYANEQLCEGNKAEMFVTVWFAIIEISTGKGIAANAGHEHPAFRSGNGQWELVKYKHSPAVATMEGMKFREHEFEIHTGDSIFVYTDGVTEATSSDKQLFGEDRLLGALNKDPMAEPKQLLENVKKDIDEFVAEAPQFDDITMMCIKWG